MAQMLAEESLQIAEQTNEAEMLLQAHNFVGEAWLCRGEFIRARTVLEQSVAFYQPQHHALTPFGGMNPQVVNLDYAALVLGYLGYLEQARMRSQEALQLTRELGHPYSFVFALTFASMLHLECGEGRVAREYTDTLVALSSEHGFPFYLAWGTLLRGAALIVQGQWEEGIAQVRQGLEMYTGNSG